MRFKGLKSFTMAKSKEETKLENVEDGDTTTAQIAEMEEKINNRTKDLENTTQQLQDLNGMVEDSDEDKLSKPHGPLSELSVEPEDDLTYDDLDVSIQPENAGEDVKLVEISAEDVVPAEPKDSGEDEKLFELGAEDAVLAEASTDVNLEDTGDSFNNLFDDGEEEVNPLANLINSLPDITVQELMDDLNEIKGIMKEWQQS